MDKCYITTLEYGRFGLPYIETIPGAKLSVEKQGNTFIIRGNPKGLRFLAHNLVALAQMEAHPETEGYHIHLDDLDEVNNGHIDIILRIENDGVSAP